MSIFHKNCYGDTYFLHAGKTKTGKPRYYMSMKTEGNLAEVLPEGYEIYEKPGGTVYVRKIPKTPILPHELQYVQDKIAHLVDEESETHYAELCSMAGRRYSDVLASMSQVRLNKFRVRFEAEIRGKEIIIYKVKGHETPMMKFVLDDEETREYAVYRWCFKGSIDDWISIGSSGQLRDLVDKYCPALGTDEFYALW